MEEIVAAVVLFLIVGAIFPPAAGILLILYVLAIIGWLLEIPKRRRFKERLEAEREKRDRLSRILSEEREYQEYKKKHSHWWD